ncbi:glutamate racemase [bacterium]|nr:glutamate racemase [bacterium]
MNKSLASQNVSEAHQRRIAFFDSGQGGLTVWESVVNKHPTLNTIYLGDNARYPYGNKGADTVTRYASEAILFLAAQNAELIVVACGTASSVAVARLKQVFRLPVIGIVEGFCAEAAQLFKPNRRVAVLGTRFTVASGRFEAVLKECGVENVWQRSCPLFVPLVEEGVSSGDIARAACRMYLSDMPSDVDVVMLACTHFPRFAAVIAETLGEILNRTVVIRSAEEEKVLYSCQSGQEPPLILLDSSSSVLAAVESFLAAHPNRNQFMGGHSELFCTDAPARFAQVAQVFANTALANPRQISLGSL